jgi:hypothetical protein
MGINIGYSRTGVASGFVIAAMITLALPGARCVDEKDEETPPDSVLALIVLRSLPGATGVFVDSCNLGSICQNFYSTGTGPTSCAAQGTYSTSKCVSTNAIGACLQCTATNAIGGCDQANRETVVYTGVAACTDDASCAASCTSSGGTYNANYVAAVSGPG